MNPARPSPGALLAHLDDIPDPGAIVRDFRNGRFYFSLLLARRGGAAFAFENRCPHAGSPLERPDGRVVVQEGRFMVCTAHGASFTPDGGVCAGGPCDGKGLTPLAIEILDGSILLRAPDSDRAGVA